MILEVDDRGELTLPAELVRASPHARLEAEREGERVVLRAVETIPKRPFDAERFPTFPGGPSDPNMTFRREEIYDDDGC